jgi:predicted dehydrogenase
MSTAAELLSTVTPRPRLGFVGVGWIGANRLLAIAEKGCADIVAVSDIRAEAAHSAVESIANEASAAKACSFEQLLGEGLDGIVIATPNGEHAAQALAALECGAHVFCQKPLARTHAEVANIIQCARHHDRLIEVDFCYRNVAGVPEMKGLVQSGAIGEVYAADLTFHNAYGPDKPWFFDVRSAGGGCVMDLGIHLLDLVLWTLEYPEVQRLSCRLYRDGKLLSAPARDFENYAIAELRFCQGATARLACSWHLPAGRDAQIEATFYGTRGAVRLRNIDGSFYDFAVEHCEGTRARALSSPSREWNAVAISDWARKLAYSPSFDPSAEHLVTVHQLIDEMYGR